MLAGKKIHFIGVLGSSMSALALWCAKLGAEVSGSDKFFDKKKAERLKTKGYFYGGSLSEFVLAADIVVYSAAVSSEEPELAYARGIHKKLYERAEFLGILTAMCSKVIAVSGAHGKTTTTAMLGEVFIKAAKNASVHIGGVSNYLNSNFWSDGGDYCITEACEYKKSFLHITPDIAIILNIDYDHPDYYKNLADVENAFVEFASKTKNCGEVILPLGCSIIDKISERLRITTFGIDKTCDICAENILPTEGGYRYDLTYFGRDYGEVMVKSPLACNVINSLAVIGAALSGEIDIEIIKIALSTFSGTERRLQLVGEFCGAEIICDYAHHPKEILAVCEEMKKRVTGKLFVVFEPHTFSRTEALIDSFSACFSDADEVAILPTFAARETENHAGDEHTLFECIENEHKYLLTSYADAEDFLRGRLTAGDIALILGAGTIDKLAKDLCAE